MEIDSDQIVIQSRTFSKIIQVYHKDFIAVINKDFFWKYTSMYVPNFE